jgi:hypothetical protein
MFYIYAIYHRRYRSFTGYEPNSLPFTFRENKFMIQCIHLPLCLSVTRIVFYRFHHLILLPSDPT